MFIINNSQDEITSVNTSINNITNDNLKNIYYFFLEILMVFIIFIIIIFIIYFSDKENRYWCKKKNKIKPIIII